MTSQGDTVDSGGGEQRVAQSNIKKEEKFDVRWESMPFKHRKIGRGPKAIHEKVCIMPLWLRNLWPTSDFDPCSVWEKTKEDESEEVVKEKAIEAAVKSSSKGGGKGGGGGGKKGGGGSSSGGKPNKKEMIQAEQAKKRAEVRDEYRAGGV